MGEHSGRYGHVAQALRARGYAVIGWDLRGHGRSSGVRGDVADGELLVADLAAVCAHFHSATLPLFIFGHSMGGQIALRLMEKDPEACRGAVIASPWLRLAFDPPWWKLLLARLAMRVYPAFVQQTALCPERLSRDLVHLASFPHPELAHRRISARMFFGLRTAGKRVLAEAGRVRTPLLLLHGDDDPITSHRATCEFFERVASADKTLRIYPGVRHEMHNDLDRASVLQVAGDWIEARLARKTD
jgi:alpha-beta hydrolase superfamily lysophospholipase